MAKPYSEDLRARVVGAVEDGATIPEAAKQCGVSISSVVRFLRLHRWTGSVSSAKFGGWARSSFWQRTRIWSGNWWRNNRISRWRSLRPDWRRRR